MANFCRDCGTALVNGVCPVCGPKEEQPAQEDESAFFIGRDQTSVTKKFLINNSFFADTLELLRSLLRTKNSLGIAVVAGCFLLALSNALFFVVFLRVILGIIGEFGIAAYLVIAYKEKKTDSGDRSMIIVAAAFALTLLVSLLELITWGYCSEMAWFPTLMLVLLMVLQEKNARRKKIYVGCMCIASLLYMLTYRTPIPMIFSCLAIAVCMVCAGLFFARYFTGNSGEGENR